MRSVKRNHMDYKSFLDFAEGIAVRSNVQVTIYKPDTDEIKRLEVNSFGDAGNVFVARFSTGETLIASGLSSKMRYIKSSNVRVNV